MTSDMISILMNSMELFISDKAPDFSKENNSSFVANDVDTSIENGVEVVKRTDVPIAEYGELYGEVVCGKIALDAPLYKGDDDDILRAGVGQSFAASQPGFGRLVLICGHNNTYFNALKNIAIDDVVEISTSYGTYSYRITETKVVEENDTTAYDISVDHEQLVMYTCYPFDMLSHTNYRFFVYGELVSGPVFVD